MARSLGKLFCAINNVTYPPTSDVSLNVCAGNPSSIISLGTYFDISSFYFNKGPYNLSSGYQMLPFRTTGGLYYNVILRLANFIGWSDSPIDLQYFDNTADPNAVDFTVGYNCSGIGGRYTIFFGTNDGVTFTLLDDFYESHLIAAQETVVM